ncbi:MAG: glycosyltransferase family 4 protein [Bacteroidota bacterium]
MKILQLCKKFPYPIKDGEAIAITNLARALHQLGGELTLLCMNTSKHYFDPQQVPASFNYYQEIHTVDINTTLRAKDAFLNLFSKDSYHIARFISTAFEERLASLLQRESFDVIQLETPYLAPYLSTIRQHSSALVAMRAHNVEYEIWERITQNTSFLPKKWYLQYLTSKLKRFEVHQLNLYDLLVSITTRDQNHFQQLGFRKQAVTVPIGIDLKDYPSETACFERPLSISFIGSLDWMPNQEGLQWFLQEVWNRLAPQYPQLQLHLAGRNTPDWIRQLATEQLLVHGEVADAHAFINDHAIMIVPLLSGSGMRVKILEGMALGKVVLTTSIGLEGIDATHQKEVLIADTADAFITNIQFALKQASQLQQIGQNARMRIADSYDNQTIAQKLLATYREALAHQK